MVAYKVLVCVGAIMALWRHTEAGCEGVPRIGWPGNDVKSATGEDFTLEDSKSKCCWLCKSTTDCVGWVYHGDNRKCYRKTALGEPKIWPADNDVWADTVGSCDGVPRIGWPANDVLSDTGETFTFEDSKHKCCRLCKETSDCIAWVYHGDNRKCYRKTTLGEPHIWSADNDVSGGTISVVDPVYTSIGCYRDTATRAIPTLEGTDARLDGDYSTRVNPIQKCAEVVFDLGYECFAVQNGGWCASSPTACSTYDTYGSSDGCKADGEGGGWANEVYRFTTGESDLGP